MNKSVVIIDYGSGNLRSVENAFRNIADGAEVVVSASPEALDKATHIVLPGVGAFGDCAAGLKAIPGMVAKLEEQVLAKKKPFIGICVGMQLLAEKGFEHGEHEGLGWIKGEVRKIEPEGNLPVPHMGWNTLNLERPSKLLEGVEGDVYFVHSYAMNCREKENVVATTTYGSAATAVVEKGNVYGVQFHPEKSQKNGLTILRNFLKV